MTLHEFPYTQIRIARPTDQLGRVEDFYKNGIGLQEIGRFDDHNGYSGIIFGLPDETFHLEFTQHKSGSSCAAPTKDNLLVFYLPDSEKRDQIVKRLNEKGYLEVEPENPYWKVNGITIEDPDGWRIVLMKVSDFRAKAD